MLEIKEGRLLFQFIYAIADWSVAQAKRFEQWEPPQNSMYESYDEIMCSLLSAGSNNLEHLLSEDNSAFLRSSSLASELEGFLFGLSLASSNQFQHFSLEWWESGDWSNEITNSLNTWMDATLAQWLVLLEGIWVLFSFSHDVSLVHTHKETRLNLCSRHLIQKIIITCSI